MSKNDNMKDGEKNMEKIEINKTAVLGASFAIVGILPYVADKSASILPIVLG